MKRAREKIRACVIDDVSHIRFAVKETLNDTIDIECIGEYGDLESFLNDLKQREDPADVVLLDIGLPGINGIEGIKYIKQLSPSVKIVMLTVYDRDNEILRALKEGADGYVLKDSSWSPRLVADAVRKAYRGGAPVDATTAKRIIEMLKSVSSTPVDHKFTAREREVLTLIQKHKTTREIATTLGITYNTAQAHVRNIEWKLNAHSKGEVIEKIIKEHLL